MEVGGEGSYGITYLGLDQFENRPVVLKQARPSKGSLARQLLEREASILQSLNHPQLPAFKEWMMIGRHPFLIMSMVEGTTLEDLIFEQGQRYGEVDSAQITLQLLELVPSISKDSFILICVFQTSCCILLYSTFESPHSATNAKELSWQEELTLSPSLIEIIERLLQLRKPYSDALDAMEDLGVFLSQARINYFIPLRIAIEGITAARLDITVSATAAATGTLGR
ncbi:protein kinase domain-containing protein [Paenibacillus phoenicis]|uniref:protein kinase domain-containing protein n=1 Tax=Paenibacillus phoenicis TaxID=554117 RepID=UPI003D2D83DE